MKTANFSTLENFKQVTGNDPNYLLINYSNQGLMVLNWFRQYGSVASGQVGTSYNIIRFTNMDNTTCDLYLPMTWISGTSTRKWNCLELPLQSKNIEIVQNAGPLDGAGDPAYPA